ncbi:hypothetical protein LTR10_021915 [Elasticomyces elasticus]|uniref:HD domain-containing protein n=1 Tax=Exophiala sideris TaxID=1016849 RepID=A0ABR0IX80_9EURO|nr:hypothetical protein LTR10_021915 [Elasticomyces elasticus]KAK5021853.1 hypothetical protein LTS07_010594 [Exophiala sideris]KAK5025918.1 hypothetical protein LTR13_010231 [Exophiala sideris]KAK5050283.1 hypothetical protein LTR69_010618 [Exophiala sideris]KAK5177112.1 hypothetical protein LTR44_010396 [Eurotiomycetes sp. CCFEE 6388]
MSSSSPFPSLPVCQITIPSNDLINAAYFYTKEHTSEATVNHCLRCAAFSLLFIREFPPLASAPIDLEAVVLSSLMHDMGWSTTKSLLSTDKRFEVDGANIARDFISRNAAESGKWDAHRIQLLWDAIALHTTPSIAQHKQPEVVAVALGILADFLGPNLPLPGNPITVERYKEIVGAFPRAGFSDELVDTLCGLCRDKPQTTFENFVSGFGKTYGLDGKGGGKEEWIKTCEDNEITKRLMGGLQACKQWDD